MSRKLPGKLPQFCAGFTTLLEDNVKNVCKHYEESFCSENTFLEMLSRCLFVFIVFFFQSSENPISDFSHPAFYFSVAFTYKRKLNVFLSAGD